MGKSTVIRAVAKRFQGRNLAGFITDEIRAGGRRVGFVLWTFDGTERTLAHVNIRSDHRVGRYGVDVSALDETARSAMQPGRELYLVDEIGKMECFSDRFVEAIKVLMDSGDPVVATVALRGRGFIAEVKQRPGAELWEVTRANRDRMADRVADRVAEWLEGGTRGHAGTKRT